MGVFVLVQKYDIPDLPPDYDFETVAIYKALAEASRHLAEVKGKASSIPNQGILIDTLSLQEAMASSEIENIVTTHDELFKGDVFPEGLATGPAKEVSLYRDSLRRGFDQLNQRGGLITNKTLIEMFQILKSRNDGFRKTPGTALASEKGGEIVYVPPQKPEEIEALMKALESFVNEPELSDLDPLVKMAIIHHQFESIHPFPDGNGRIGRILNVLYLTKMGLLDIPILYLSREINITKPEYYRLLQSVREEGNWEEWVIYLLDAISRTSQATLEIIEGIKIQMSEYKHRIRGEFSFYSQDLINNLFRHPYTRIEYLQNDIGVSRQTAAKYLDSLAEAGFVKKHKEGKDNYYINLALVELLMRISSKS